LQGNFDADPVVDGASNIQGWLTERVAGLPRVPVAIGILILVAWAIVVGIRRRDTTPPSPNEHEHIDRTPHTEESHHVPIP
ncbi:MAG: hypothetical protein ABIP03_08740, partial [Aquihabitans sp.]